MKRRTIATGALAGPVAALALIAADPAAAQDLRDVRVTQAVASFAFLPIDYAVEARLFEAEGLNVQQIATRGGGPDLTALVSGDVEFNAAAGTYQIGAIAAERDIINVYNFYDRNLIDLVLSTEAAEASGYTLDDPFEERIKAIEGLSIGMTRPGSLTDKQVRHLVRQAGLQEDDVEVVAIGGPPNLLSALEQGQIDGFAISIPHPQVAEARGTGVIWVDNPAGDDPSIDPFMMESLLTTQEFADENPEVVEAMVRALTRAVEEIGASTPEEIREVVQDVYARVDPEIMLRGIAAAQGALNETGEVSMEMAENTLMLDGRTDQVSAEELYQTFTDRFLP